MFILALHWRIEQLWAALVVGTLVVILGMTSVWQKRGNVVHVLGGATSAVLGGLVAAWGALVLLHMYFS